MKFLNFSGMVASIAVGTGVALGFGIKGLILLGIFFVSSSLLSKFKQKKKAYLKEIHAKGSERDWTQVVANGGAAAGVGFFASFYPDQVWVPVIAVLISSVNADTWASEIGTMVGKAPISVRNFKKVEAGTSGAVTVEGTLAAAAGSLAVTVAAGVLFVLAPAHLLIIFFLGFTGCFIDTWLGAFVQGSFKCRVCSLNTERAIHCSEPTRLISGRTWINNDMVNFWSSVIPAAIAYFIFLNVL